MKKEIVKNTEVKPEFIYKVIASSSGVRIFKFKIGSINSKNLYYMAGSTRKRVAVSDLDTYWLSEATNHVVSNPGCIYTCKNLDEDLELKETYLKGCLEIYYSKIVEYINELKEIEAGCNKLFMSDLKNLEIKTSPY